MSTSSSIPSPFSISCSPALPELLHRLNCSVALSTYQAGKLIFISSADGQKLNQLPRQFDKPMGIGLDKDKLVLATKQEVTVFRNSVQLAVSYPPAVNTYDALYLPRQQFLTASLDLHDIEFGSEGIYAVNTLFSCIVRIDGEYSFTPYWKPPFIDKLSSEDRCHLNGMAMVNGKPKYASAFSETNKAAAWRENITQSGILMDVENNEIILRGLGMPHSPRWYKDQLYLLLSASGELIKYKAATKSYETIRSFKGFVRGMDFIEDYAFIAFSKLRKNSSTFAKLPFADQADKCGFMVLHLPTAAIVGEAWYQTSVDEIYDLRILPSTQRPNILNIEKSRQHWGLHLPDTTFWSRPPED